MHRDLSVSYTLFYEGSDMSKNKVGLDYVYGCLLSIVVALRPLG